MVNARVSWQLVLTQIQRSALFTLQVDNHDIVDLSDIEGGCVELDGILEVRDGQGNMVDVWVEGWHGDEVLRVRDTGEGRGGTWAPGDGQQQEAPPCTPYTPWNCGGYQCSFTHIYITSTDPNNSIWPGKAWGSV